jgi:hypothetical protein
MEQQLALALKTTDDIFDSRSSPRTESLVATAVQWAERIMRKIDGYGKSRGGYPGSMPPQLASPSTTNYDL